MSPRTRIVEQQVRAIELILSQTKSEGSPKPRLDVWKQRTRALLAEHCGKGKVEEFDAAVRAISNSFSSTYRDDALALRDFIVGVRDDLMLLEAPAEPAITGASPIKADGAPGEQALVWLCHQFHTFATQIAKRRSGRAPYLIEDEYDLQDSMHALLRMHFADVRPEEPSPSEAGAASRMDFLLKRERTVLELKRSRESMTARQIGEQLLVDIHRYSAHPDCDHLVCFVYDPEGRIANAHGVASDLMRAERRLRVTVLILPR